MRNSEVDARSSDDEIYRWFVGSLAYLGSAAEVEPGVIRVRLTGEDGDGGPGSSGRVIDVVVSRQELRSVAWAEDDVFDDRNEPVVPASRNPVRSGLAQLSLFAEEALATARPTERYVVFHRGRLVPSVRREVPPVRGPYDEPESAPPGAGRGCHRACVSAGCHTPCHDLAVHRPLPRVPVRERRGVRRLLRAAPRRRARGDGGGADAVALLGVRRGPSRLRVPHLAPADPTGRPHAHARDDLGRAGGPPDGRGRASDDVGEVEFRARFRTPAGEHVLHETSRFERRRGRWVYVDGDVVR